jgi:tetratricopeptide (TPR) repeat protein
VKHDPFAPRLRYILANALIAAGQYSEAESYCLTLPADFPGKNEWLARAYMGQGKTQQALQILEDTAERGADLGLSVQGFLGYAYGRAGRRDEAEKIAAKVPDAYDQALTFAGMEDKERALDALERMAPLGPARLGRNLNYPEFNFVRNDPRLKALRNKVGLP